MDEGANALRGQSEDGGEAVSLRRDVYVRRGSCVGFGNRPRGIRDLPVTFFRNVVRKNCHCLEVDEFLARDPVSEVL